MAGPISTTTTFTERILPVGDELFSGLIDCQFKSFYNRDMSKIPPELSVDQIGGICVGFTAIKKIAEGGFKCVYTASKSGETEIIKVIGIPNPGDTNPSADEVRYREECVGRVRREVEILASCESPLLVKLGSMPLATHNINGADYVVYSEEYLDGDDLWKILKRTDTRPDEIECKLLMQCLIKGIRELWSMGYIHRDIKPKNVIKLSNSQRPFVLLDLGIAFSQFETALTANSGMVPATFRYFAPEMADPNFRANLDYRADLYTSALTVFEYASGEHPIAHDSDDAIRTVTRALRNPPRSLSELCPTFSRKFTSLIDQLLKKKPALRPANFDLILKRLEDA